MKYSPMNPFFANSRVNLLVIFSSSCSLYSLGLSFRPAFPPPNGTSTQAHLKVIRADKAFTSSRVTSSEYRIPATFQTTLYLILFVLFLATYFMPVVISDISYFIFTIQMFFHDLIYISYFNFITYLVLLKYYILFKHFICSHISFKIYITNYIF